jgi:hypothetical protein
MKHRIFISTEVEKVTAQQEEMLLRCIDTALAEEGMEFPCEVNVLLTDDQGIRTLNREQRNIDAPTDVLSFPMFELLPGVPVAEEENDNFDRFELEEDLKAALNQTLAQAKGELMSRFQEMSGGIDLKALEK